MLRAMNPMVSRLGASGMQASAGMRPQVGFNAVTPQQCPGMRTDPPVSEPSAAKQHPAATSAGGAAGRTAWHPVEVLWIEHVAARGVEAAEARTGQFGHLGGPDQVGSRCRQTFD